MPIWLRRYTHNRINEYYITEKEEFDKHMNKNQITENTKLSDLPKNLPKVNVPSYVSTVKKGK
jgi:hypothetical protein